MPMIAIDQTANYLEMLRSATPISYMKNTHVSSGDYAELLVEPIGAQYHVLSYYSPAHDFSLTIPKKETSLTAEEDRALWMALKDSTRLVRKGRLINK